MATKTPRRRGAARTDNRAALILSSPLVIFLVVMLIYPIGLGMWTAVTNKSLLVTDPHFIGLDNFSTVLNDERFWSALTFTLIFATISTTVTVITGYGLAVLANRKFPGKRVMFTLLLLPVMVAPALMGVMYSLLLNDNIGALPVFLKDVLGLRVSLFNPKWTAPLLLVLDIVQWTPFTFLILYANLQSIPNSMYEAARIDGASGWQINRYIVLPMMVPAFAAAAFLRGVDALRTFDVINVLTGGGPGDVTTTLSIYIYKVAFVDSAFGVATAASVIVVVMMLPMIPLVVGRLTRNNR